MLPKSQMQQHVTHVLKSPSAHASRPQPSVLPMSGLIRGKMEKTLRKCRLLLPNIENPSKFASLFASLRESRRSLRKSGRGMSIARQLQSWPTAPTINCSPRKAASFSAVRICPKHRGETRCGENKRNDSSNRRSIQGLGDQARAGIQSKAHWHESVVFLRQVSVAQIASAAGCSLG